MKRIFILVTGLFLILGVFVFKTEKVVVDSVKADVIEVSDEDTKTDRVDVLNQNEHERLYDKYKSEYESIYGEVFYVLIGEKFGELELFDTVKMRLQRSYLQFRGGEVFTVDTTMGYEGVTDIDELRRRGIKYSEMSTYDIPAGMQMLPNTIVSEEVLKQWEEEGYDGKGSYWKKSPKGLTYGDMKARIIKTDGIYKKYEAKYESIKGVTFYVLISERFGESIYSEIESFNREYIAFRDGQSYPAAVVQFYDNVSSLEDVRNVVLEGGFNPEKLLLNENTIVSEEVLKQWKEEGYDGEGSYWEKAPEGLSYEDLVQQREKSLSVYELKNGERFFETEVIPKSQCEKIILDYLRVQISDEYDKIKDLHVERKVDNYRKSNKDKTDDGMYTEEITVHNMRTLREEEYTGDPKDIRYYPYMKKLEKYDPSEFKIIKVDYTNKLTEKYDRVAQWGSGYWTRYYVMVKKDEKSGYRIFDVYGHM